jgi:DNA-directed RNA polymerase specialized sigma subunit
MYPKQKSYIPRFALLIHLFNDYSENIGAHEISKESILKAEKLSKYFVETAKKVKINQVEVKELQTTIKAGKTNAEKLKLIFEENPDFNRSKTAELLGISRMQVGRLLKQITEK